MKLTKFCYIYRISFGKVSIQIKDPFILNFLFIIVVIILPCCLLTPFEHNKLLCKFCTIPCTHEIAYHFKYVWFLQRKHAITNQSTQKSISLECQNLIKSFVWLIIIENTCNNNKNSDLTYLSTDIILRKCENILSAY